MSDDVRRVPLDGDEEWVAGGDELRHECGDCGEVWRATEQEDSCYECDSDAVVVYL